MALRLACAMGLFKIDAMHFPGSRRKLNRGCLFAVFLLLSLMTRADDWPQWLGPLRDGVWRETGIVETLPTNGFKYRWRVPLGGGYSGPAVANGRVFVMDRQLAAGGKRPSNAFSRGEIAGNERVLCLNESDG